MTSLKEQADYLKESRQANLLNRLHDLKAYCLSNLTRQEAEKLERNFKSLDAIIKTL